MLKTLVILFFLFPSVYLAAVATVTVLMMCFHLVRYLRSRDDE